MFPVDIRLLRHIFKPGSNEILKEEAMKKQNVLSVIMVFIIMAIMISSPLADKIDGRVDRLTAELNLSADQSTQIQQILENTTDSTNKKSVHQQIENILNDDQRRQYRDIRRNDGYLKDLNERLNLSVEQAEEIQSIMTSVSQEIEQTRENENSDRRVQREAMKKIMDKRDDKIKSILNDEQKADFEKLIAEQRQNEQKNRPPGKEKR